MLSMKLLAQKSNGKIQNAFLLGHWAYYVSSRPSIGGLKKQWCPEVVDLMERMWAQDHQDRPTMSEVVEELEALVSHR